MLNALPNINPERRIRSIDTQKASFAPTRYNINNTFEYVSLLFDFSKDSLKKLVNDFIHKLNIKER